MFKQKLAVAVAAALAGMSFHAVAAEGESATTVGGKMFADFTNISAKSNSAKTAASGTGVDVKRFYLSVGRNIDSVWSANLTTDFNYEPNTVTVTSPAGGTATTKAGGETQVYIKKAYVQAKFSDAAVFRLGSADMAWIPFAESLYGYRYVEGTIADRLKFGTSADWGLHLGGKVDMFTYALSAVNGAGYKNPTRSNSMDVEGRISVSPFEGFTVAAGFYNGKLGNETATTPAKHTASRVDALVAYVSSGFRVGAEYFTADNWSNVTSTATDKADGASVWGSIGLSEKTALFARVDSAKPNKTTAATLKDTYYNLGVTYAAAKGVDFALVYKQEKVEKGSISTANGTIGGTTDGTYNEIGVWTQVAF